MPALSNAAGFPILSLITWLPIVGCLVLMTIRGEQAVVDRNARWAALWVSLIVFAISLKLWWDFDPAQAGFQFNESVEWLPQFKVGYKMGVDGISVLFVLLSTALTPICILASWDAVTLRVREYMISFLVLETMMVGAFAATDFIVFYMFFEGLLIPMYIIIGVWGGPRRVYASFKFFLYTLAGSVLMLLALLAMWYQAGTTDIAVLLHTPFPPRMQFWLFLAFLASFAVKVPMWPVHTWLPDAHVEAPTAGSVILAGVLLAPLFYLGGVLLYQVYFHAFERQGRSNTLQSFTFDEGLWSWPQGYAEPRPEPRFQVAVLDYGIKRNILRALTSIGARATVLPASTPAEEVLARAPDGVLLSNGPGDPSATGDYAGPEIRKLVDSGKPVFGICLGHQMLSLALGAKTIKMDQGHHGANHPVKDLETGRVEIVSMNHGFTVDRDGLPDAVQETHVSLFDGSNAGIRLRDRPVFSVQHHPEASPGPTDSLYLFDRFAEMMAH